MPDAEDIVQRKVLNPVDFESTAELARTLNEFDRRYDEIPQAVRLEIQPPRLPALLDRLPNRDQAPHIFLTA